MKWSGRLGLFEETTYADCSNNEANKNACYYSCVLAGGGGWNGILLNACQSVCITEACGKGILLTPHGMGAVIGKIGDCLTFCNAQADKLDDPTAREAAKAACPATCGLYSEVSKLPASDQKPAPGASIPIPGQKPPSKPPPTPTPTTPSSAGVPASFWLWGLGIIGVIAAVVLPKNSPVYTAGRKKRAA